MLRSHLNRVVLLVGLAIALPTIALGERVRAGLGRQVAVRAVRRIARLCGIRIEVHGAARLDPTTSYVLVPNHSSPMDIAALLVARPDARFVAAAELFRIPLLGSAMRALGTVPIERGNRRAAHERIRRLSAPEADRRLVMFAEGGIAPTDEVLPFKTGAFVVAIDSGADVVPVAISGASTVLPRRARLRLRTGTVRVDLLPPVPTDGLRVHDRRDLARRVRDQVVASLDHRRLAA